MSGPEEEGLPAEELQSRENIEIEVLLPPNYDNSLFLEMPRSVTVERVKWAALSLIEDFPSKLFPSFLLGVSEEDLLNVEFVRFETCHTAISRTLEMGQVMTLYLVPHVTSEQKRDLNSRLTMMRKKCLTKPAASSSSRDLRALRSATDEPDDATQRSIAASSDEVATHTGSKSASRRTVRRSQSFSSDLPQFLATRVSENVNTQEENSVPEPDAVVEEEEELDETPEESDSKGPRKRLVRAQSSMFNVRPKSTLRSKLVNSHRESPLQRPYAEKAGRFPVKVVLDNSAHVVLQTEQTSQQEFAQGMISKLQMMISLLQNGYLLDEQQNAILEETDLIKPSDDEGDDQDDAVKTYRLLRPDSGHSPNNRRLSDTPERWNVSRGTQRMKTIALGFQRTNFSPKELFKSEKLAGVQIGSLIGRPLCWGNAPSDPTIQNFRTQVVRRLEQYHNVRYEKITRAPVAKYPLLSSVELPMHFDVHFWHHDTCHVTEVSCDLDLTVLEALARMKKKNAADIVVEKDFVYDKMVVKIQGTNEFVLERGRLIDIVSVRTDLQSKRTPTFVLVPYGVLQAKLNLFLSAEERQAEPQFENRVPLPAQFTPVSEVVDPFEMRVVALEMTTPSTASGEEKLLYVECALWHGEETMCDPVRTPSKPFSSLLYLHSIRFALPTRDIPKATRLSLTVYEENRNGGKDEMFAWAVLQLVDYKNEMLSGPQHLSLWTTPNRNTHHAPTPCTDSPYTLIFELPRLSQPVVYISTPLPPSQDSTRTTQPSAKEQAILDHVLSKDCLYEMTQREKQTIWKWRLRLRAEPNSLGFIVRSVSWNLANQVARLHHLLLDWPAMDPYPALALLDFCIMDERVRTFAVQCLQPLTNAQVSELMLQFVQVLKYEPHHDSSLARFLLHRALVDKGTVGHAFFWNLRSEILVSQFAERFSLLAETYLRCCDEHRGELVKQVEMVSKLRRIAVAIQKVPLPKRNDVLREQIKSTHLKSDVQIPSNPHVSVQSLLIDQCKAKDSFTAPLWLEWRLNDWTPRDVTRPMIFKVGDDLRQDGLSLQAIRLMDHIWKSNGLDFHMSTYNVLATGDCMGFIEVVRDASSIADIQKGAGGAAAAISKIPLQRWLLKHNPTEEEYDTAVRKFTYSCAGYSVASYILGLGDRHNDNIMVTKAGQLFHIDFAHFMGNIMKWKGIKRETAPFVLTPEIAYVMGGEKGKAFKKFTSVCCEAFNILRKEANVFLTLFLLMRHTGIPQLGSKADVEYMRKAFMLDLSDEQASEAFQKLITKCLSSLATRANFLIHILAHPDKD